jgi:hypothetical protein
VAILLLHLACFHCCLVATHAWCYTWCDNLLFIWYVCTARVHCAFRCSMHVCQTINIQYVYICQCMYVCMLTGLLPRGIRNASSYKYIWYCCCWCFRVRLWEARGRWHWCKLGGMNGNIYIVFIYWLDFAQHNQATVVIRGLLAFIMKYMIYDIYMHLY